MRRLHEALIFDQLNHSFAHFRTPLAVGMALNLALN